MEGEMVFKDPYETLAEINWAKRVDFGLLAALTTNVEISILQEKPTTDFAATFLDLIRGNDKLPELQAAFDRMRHLHFFDSLLYGEVEVLAKRLGVAMN